MQEKVKIQWELQCVVTTPWSTGDPDWSHPVSSVPLSPPRSLSFFHFWTDRLELQQDDRG